MQKPKEENVVEIKKFELTQDLVMRMLTIISQLPANKVFNILEDFQRETGLKITGQK